MARPNIVLVSIDSLRADHCGFLGNTGGITPNLDALAQDGIAFENAIAPGPQTFSSMPAVFTGHSRRPDALTEPRALEHWERRIVSIRDHMASFRSLPDRLRDLGYATAGITPNPWTSRACGFHRGFDRFEDRSAGRGVEGDHGVADRIRSRLTGWKPIELGLDLVTDRSFFSRWETLYDPLIDIRDELPQPYFIWIFLLETHFPFMASGEFREERSAIGMVLGIIAAEKAMRGNVETLSKRRLEAVRGCYRDAVRSVDGFLKRLKVDVSADEPVVMIHADHGESLGEHGNFGHDHRQVYEENVHVPLVIHNAGVAGNVRQPVSLSALPDIATCIARGDGFDPMSVGQSRVEAMSECGKYGTVRGTRFKYVKAGDDARLFDLSRDPDESVDVSPQHPTVRREMQHSLEAFESHTIEVSRMGRVARSAAMTGDF